LQVVAGHCWIQVVEEVEDEAALLLIIFVHLCPLGAVSVVVLLQKWMMEGVFSVEQLLSVMMQEQGWFGVAGQHEEEQIG